MTELPGSWINVRFTDLLDIQGGTQPPKKTFVYEPKSGYIRLLQIRDFGEKPLPTFIPDKHSLKKCDEDDILIGRYGASVGRICTGMTGAYNVALTKVLIPEELEKRYILWLLNSPLFQRVITSFDRSAQNGFNKDDLAGIAIPLAPLNEQKRIVAKLDELLPKVEACKERLQKIPTILKRFRQSVLAAAVSGKLTEGTVSYREEPVDQNTPDFGEIPAHWKFVPLSEITHLITKGSSPKWQGVNYTDRGVLFITSENVGECHLIMDGKTKYLEEKFNDIQPRSILRTGDVLTNLVGASIGRCAVYDLEHGANINQAVAVIRVKDDLLNRFLMLVLNSLPVINWMHQEKVDVARANLSLTQLSNLRVPLPDIEEQRMIVEKVEELFHHLQEMRRKRMRAERFVEQMQESILDRAFSGTLVSQDPTDEPATALLEHIKANAAQQNNGKPKRKRRLTGKRTRKKSDKSETGQEQSETNV